MKTITNTFFIVKATVYIIGVIATLASFLLACYMSLHSTGHVRSGWDMLMFGLIAIMVLLLCLIDPKPNLWLVSGLLVSCLAFVFLFGLHYFLGDEGLQVFIKRWF